MTFDLTSYMDEAGHCDDPTRHYVGMAGFVAPAVMWEDFDVAWKAILNDFGLKEPFHMKDFAHFHGQFEVGWKGDENKAKRDKLFGALMAAIKETEATPVGAIISVEDFNGLTKCQRDSFRGPYFIAFQFVTRGAALEGAFGLEPEKVAMVYAYNQEYGTISSPEPYSVDQSGRAESLWHAMKETTDWGKWMGAYASSTPTEISALQAADIFAYELAKEFETLVNPNPRPMRYGLRQILQMTSFPHSLIRLLDRMELLRLVIESRMPCQMGTDEVPKDQMLVARRSLVEWMQDRGKLISEIGDSEL